MKSVLLFCGFVAPVLWLISDEKWDTAWIECSSQGTGFTASFPRQPQVSLEPDVASGARPGRNFVAYRADDAGTQFAVTYSDLSWRAVQEHDFLFWVHRDFASGTRIVSRISPVAAAGSSASSAASCELVCAGDDGMHTRRRAFLVGLRLFLVEVTGSTTAVNSTQAETFLDSFRALPVEQPALYESDGATRHW